MTDRPGRFHRGIWSSWLIRTLLVGLLTIGPLAGVRAVVAYRALELGATPAQLGTLATSFAVLALATGVPMGRWIDRFGEPRFVLLGATVLAATSLWMTTVGSVVLLIAAQAGLGFGQIALAIGMQTIVANGGPADERVLRFGAFTLVNSIGQMLSPGLATAMYGASGSAGAVFLWYAALSVVAMAVAVWLWLRPPPKRGTATTPPTGPSSILGAVGRVLRQRSVPQVMFGSIATVTTLELLTIYLPAYGQARGIAPATIGLLLSVRATSSVVSRVGLGPLLRLLGRRGLLLWSLIVPTLALALVPTTTSTTLLFVLMAVGGLGLGLGQPVSMSWVADLVPRDIRGTALAVRLSGNRVGQLLVPVTTGLIASLVGVGAAFVAMAAMLGTAAATLTGIPRDTPARGTPGEASG